MRTGRPRKPIEERIADGTLRASDPQTPLLMGGRCTSRPSCPSWLSRDGKRAFGLIVRTLWDSGVLDIADTLLVSIAADALGDAVAASRDVKTNGMTIKQKRITRSGDKYTVQEKNPAYQIKADALKRFHATCSELGIGPVARAHLAASGASGLKPKQALPGAGAKPTPLKVVRSA